MAELRVADEDNSKQGWSDAERAAVAQELARVLANATFKTSNRCVELLSCLVGHVLAGDVEGIKERTLGVEVFGREADYDTNADPIVRRTANEIRKRLAQCYQETHRHYPVKIHLLRGGYLPEFEFAAGDTAAGGAIAPPASSAPPKAPNAGAMRWLTAAKRPYSPWLLGLCAVVLIVAGGFFLLRFRAHHSPQYMVWKPLLDSRERVIVCLSDNTPLGSGDGKDGSRLIQQMIANPQAPPAPISRDFPAGTAFMDARVAYTIAARLWSLNKQTSLLPSSALKLEDFRQRPSVLIGGTNNPWVLALLSELRYSIRIDPVTNDKWIQDSYHPANRDWKIDGQLQFTDTRMDYAVITRFFDKETGQWLLALGGLEAYATESASELLTNPSFAHYLPASVGQQGNFQIVIQTSVINGNLGQLKVLAVHTW